MCIYCKHRELPEPSPLAFIVFLLGLVLIFATLANAGQTQPDAKRVKELQAALVAHGYESGKTWHDTQEILRSIAHEHDWQTLHAPDARVLRLLGFTTPAYDTQMVDPATQGRTHLDGEPRDKVARAKKLAQ